MNPSISKPNWTRFLRFAVTGGTAFAIDFALYYGLTRSVHLPYLVSRTISLAIAMIWNFTLNRTWTFQATEGKVSRQISRFIIVMTTTSLLSLALMRLGVSSWHLNDLFVLVAVSLLIMLINFFAHKLWSYQP